MNDFENDKQISTIRDYKIDKANDLIQKTRHNLTTQEQKVLLYLNNQNQARR